VSQRRHAQPLHVFFRDLHARSAALPQEALLVPDELAVARLQRRGVYWRQGLWDAVIESTQHRVDAGGPLWEVLGSYADPAVAARVYDRAVVMRGWQVRRSDRRVATPHAGARIVQRLERGSV